MKSLVGSLLEARGSLENPATSLSNPAAWFMDWATGGNRTYTGKAVNEKTALRSTTVFACVRVIAESIASLPLIVYERQSDGSRKPATDHPVYHLLHDTPNPWMSSFTWRETLQGHACLWGNGYSEIEFNGRDEPIGLWPLLPDRTKPKVSGGEQYYETTIAGKPEPLGIGNVLHVPGLGWNGREGYSVLAMAKQAVALGLAAEEFGARFFGQGSRPSGVIEGEGKLDPDAAKRLRDGFERVSQGLENSHRTVVLEHGFTWKQIGMPLEEAQFLETRKFQVEDIARLFRVPLVLIGHTEKSTSWGTGIEHFMIAFVVHTLRPWIVRWEQELNRKLFRPSERGRFFCEFKVDGLLRGDIKTRYEAYAIGRQNSWLSPNDIRQLENMEPVEGGDEYHVQLNLVPLNWEPPAITPPDDDPAPSDPERSVLEQRAKQARMQRSVSARRRIQSAHVESFTRAWQRSVKREVDAVEAAVERFLSERSLTAFDEWLEEFYRGHREFTERALQGAFRTFAELIHAEAAEEIGAEPDFGPSWESFLTRFVKTSAVREAGFSIGQLRKLMSEFVGEELEAAIRTRVSEWGTKRAGKLASLELVALSGAVARETYSTGGRGSVWVSSADPCPLCASLDGRTVSGSEPFLSAGEEVNPGGDTEPLRTSSPVGHPPLHGGCECSIAAA